MPELPEVETTRRGIEPHVVGRRITGAIVRQPRLRWPVPAHLSRLLTGRSVAAVERRGKYLLLRCDKGTLIIHLCMSGSLRVLPAASAVLKHDHLDLLLSDGQCLRLHDPRRFGAVLWTADEEPLDHPLLASLGPEPLSPGFDGAGLHARARGRRTAVKPFLMDSRVVVGVGNIYANEALFLAGIHPARAAGRIAATRYEVLAAAVKQVLQAALAQGGTTLRDFVGSDGRPGYFAQQLRVYGRGGEPCRVCKHPLTQRLIGQRSSYFCARCQH